jgi:DNA mismatch endonuclease (patch repair protein)
MVDNLTKDQRSKNMSRIRSKNTKPEMIVRKKLHSLGYRYRLHKKELPGKPDIFLKKFNLAIFVNGCFWHQHGCKKTSMPKSNKNYWTEKLKKNVIKDKKNKKTLLNMGFNVLTMWECEIVKNGETLEKFIIKKFKNYHLN